MDWSPFQDLFKDESEDVVAAAKARYLTRRMLKQDEDKAKADADAAAEASKKRKKISLLG